MKGSSESENADAPRPLNCPILDPPTGGWSNPSVRMGRSPAHVQGFWGHAMLSMLSKREIMKNCVVYSISRQRDET